MTIACHNSCFLIEASLNRISSLTLSVHFSYPQIIQGAQEKLCFFTIHCYPYLAYNSVRDLQSSQHIASVQPLLLAGNFLYNQ